MRVNEQVKAASRRALLDAAAAAFATRGYHDANIDRVSQEAGLAKGTVYNYFASKRAIFDAVLLEACALAAQSADAIPSSAPTAARLEAFVAGNLVWAQRNQPLAILFARELIGGDAATRELIFEASLPCVEKVAAILEQGRQRGELAFEAPAGSLAVTFIVLANALMLQASSGDGTWPSSDALPNAVARLFLHGVAAPAGAV